MAAFMGTTYGTTEMPSSHKTIVGFVSFTITAVIGQYVLGIERGFMFILSSSGICALVEVYSGSLDNFIVDFVY